MNNKVTKHKINLFDIIIIIAIIGIVGVMYYYTTARNSVLSNTEIAVEYVVELKTVRAEHIDKIKIGDAVVETVRDQQIGEVVNVEVTPSYNIATNLNTGEMFLSTYPNLNDVTTTNEIVESNDVVEEEITTSEDTVQDTNTDTEVIEEKPEPKYDYYNVKVTIRDDVKKSDSGYSINGFEIIVGELVHFRVPEYVNSGYCVNIREVE